MKTTNETATVSAKSAKVANQENKVSKKLTKASVKKRIDVYDTQYEKDVLTVNRNLKKEVKSLGGARAILMQFAKEIKMSSRFVTILKLSKEQINYKILESKVRTSKAGNYSPFYLLQSLNKNYQYFKDNFKK